MSRSARSSDTTIPSRTARQLESLASTPDRQFQARAIALPSPISIDMWNRMDIISIIAQRKVRASTCQLTLFFQHQAGIL